MSAVLPPGRLTGYCMEMQLDVLNFVPILSAAGPGVRQVLVFGGGLLLLAIPVIVLRVRPFSIAVAEDAYGAFIGLALLVICGGMSGVLFSCELVRSYGFSSLWYYALPILSAASVYFQYTSCKCPGMLRALSHSSSAVRESAAKMLGNVGDERAVDPLIQTLSDDIPDVRQAAAEALGRLGDKRAVDPLIEALSDDAPAVRKSAAEALGRLEDKRAVDPLIEGLSDDTPSVQGTTAEALGRLGDKRAFDPLIEALSDNNADVREAAAEALGRLGDKRAVDPLIEALSDRLPTVRKAAVEALGQLGDKRAIDPLVKNLSDNYPSGVLDAARAALKKLGYKK